jgi:hypothetical protein
MKKLLFSLFLLTNTAHAHVDCLLANINDVYLMPSQTATVSSHHKIIITNDLGTVASYSYTLQLCADDQG